MTCPENFVSQCDKAGKEKERVDGPPEGAFQWCQGSGRGLVFWGNGIRVGFFSRFGAGVGGGCEGSSPDDGSNDDIGNTGNKNRGLNSDFWNEVESTRCGTGGSPECVDSVKPADRFGNSPAMSDVLSTEKRKCAPHENRWWQDNNRDQE